MPADPRAPRRRHQNPRLLRRARASRRRRLALRHGVDPVVTEARGQAPNNFLDQGELQGMAPPRRLLRRLFKRCDPAKFRGTMSALDVLRLQMDDMLRGSTSVAYKLASPANRRATAPGYDALAFESLVRNETYLPLLNATAYEVLRVSHKKCFAVFDVLLYAEDIAVPTHGFRFALSRQTEEERHPSVHPFEMSKDSQFWRTDAVTPILSRHLNAIQEKIALQKKMQAPKNVLGTELKPCSTGRMARTGYAREGACAHVEGDAGKHHVCLKMDSDFCARTGQSDWCADRMPCHDDPTQACPIENWCVCQWAFSDYVHGKTCDGVEIECDATNMHALEAYSRDPKHTEAYECIKSKCSP